MISSRALHRLFGVLPTSRVVYLTAVPYVPFTRQAPTDNEQYVAGRRPGHAGLQ